MSSKLCTPAGVGDFRGQIESARFSEVVGAAVERRGPGATTSAGRRGRRESLTPPSSVDLHHRPRRPRELPWGRWMARRRVFSLFRIYSHWVNSISIVPGDVLD